MTLQERHDHEILRLMPKVNRFGSGMEVQDAKSPIKLRSAEVNEDD